MTATHTLSGSPRPERTFHGLHPLTTFRAVLANWRDRFEARRALVQLSRLDERLLRDVGVDPDAVYDAVEGSWDEIARLRRL